MDLLVSLIRQYKRGGRSRFLEANVDPALVVRLPVAPSETWNEFGTDTLPQSVIQEAVSQSPEEIRAVRRAEGLWVVKIRKSPLNRPGGPITVGRSRDCDVVLTDTNVSRVHARFEFDAAGAVSLADNGSRNGTSVNGARLETDKQMPLKPGDVIVFGQINATYESPQTLSELVRDLLERKSAPKLPPSK